MRVMLRVVGSPSPQGSKRAFLSKSGDRVVMLEQSKGVKPWRAAIQAEWVRKYGNEAVRLMALPKGKRAKREAAVMGPAHAIVTFLMPDKTGKRAGQPCTVAPDIDKLLRATFDALTECRIVQDDSRIAIVSARKEYCVAGQQPGAIITVDQEL